MAKRLLGVVTLAVFLIGPSVAWAEDWPLPIPRNIRIDSPADLKGVLIRWEGGAVFQIEEAVWEISPEGDLGYASFKGYNREGNRIEFQKSKPSGRLVQSSADLEGMRLGDPDQPETIVLVDSIVFGTNDEGLLSVIEEYGYRPAIGEYVTYAQDDQSPCGVVVESACDATTCNGACGAHPGCPCSGQAGACSGSASTRCEGSCPQGYTCFNKSGVCGCHQTGGTPGGGCQNIGGDQSNGTVELAPKGSGVVSTPCPPSGG